MARIYAGILGCLAMVLVIARSIWIGMGLELAATNATLALVIFSLMGAAFGQLAETTIVEAVRYKLERELESSKPPQSGSAFRAA